MPGAWPPPARSARSASSGQGGLAAPATPVAVRRANDLIARIEDGLVASDVRDGTVTALDLAGVVVP